MKNATGPIGEAYAAKLLKRRGYQLITKNFRTRFGEVDIIAANSTYILFVEVKTRMEGSLTSPAEAVTPAKQRKIVAAAQAYLVQNPTKLQPRFDVVAVYTSKREVTRAEVIENAF